MIVTYYSHIKRFSQGLSRPSLPVSLSNPTIVQWGISKHFHFASKDIVEGPVSPFVMSYYKLLALRSEFLWVVKRKVHKMSCQWLSNCRQSASQATQVCICIYMYIGRKRLKSIELFEMHDMWRYLWQLLLTPFACLKIHINLSIFTSRFGGTDLLASSLLLDFIVGGPRNITPLHLHIYTPQTRLRLADFDASILCQIRRLAKTRNSNR